VSVTVVFETHATSEDNEAGIATGWLPGPALGCRT
jgi:probable phosphoglycerate mutase